MDKQLGASHHGVSLGGSDNLATYFDIRTRIIHDLTVSGFCSRSVVVNWRGVDLALDHHRYAPHENLFTDLDLDAAARGPQAVKPTPLPK